MDKVTRIVTIIIAVIIAVGAVILAFFLTQSKVHTDTNSVSVDSTDETIQLVSANEEHVESLKVHNQHGTYTIVPYGEENEDIGPFYTVEGMDIKEIDPYTVNNIVKYGCNPASINQIGCVEKLSDYGLDHPTATVSIVFENGETYDYQIGKAVNNKQDTYYMCAKDSNNVYVISVEPELLGTVDNLLNKTIFAISQYEYVDKNNFDAAENGFSRLVISNSNLPKEVEFEKVNGSTYRIANFPDLKPNDSTLDAIKSNLEDLKANQVVAKLTNQAQLSQYGLAEPKTSISFTVNNQTFKLLIGNQDNGMYYVKRDDSDVIYKVSDDKIADVTHATLFTLTDPTVYATDDTDFSSIELNNGQQKAVITLERQEDQNKSTESKKYYKYTPSLNNKSMEQKTYDAAINAIKGLKVEQDTDLKAEGTPDFTITIKHYDTDRIDTISFYKKDDNVLVDLNGMVRGTISAQTFTNFEQEMPL